MEEKATTPHANPSLRYQLYKETRAMAEYALADGKIVPDSAIRTIEKFTITDDNGASEHINVRADLDIGELVLAHGALVKIVEPAKPNTILLLDLEKKKKGYLSFLGPVSLIRQMMVAAILSLVFFITLAMNQGVNQQGGNIMSQHGADLLINLLFYLAAAGLGAAFAGLYKANAYIANGTFDPTYHASYWIRFFLGLIAGLILAVMVSEDYFSKGSAGEADFKFLEQGIVRPLLAMLGGFSADLTYTILNRLVETVQSLFTGSPKNQITGKKQAIQADFESQQNQQQINMASNLIQLQQIVNRGATPEELSRKINLIIKDTMPGVDIPPEPDKEKKNKPT